MKINIVGPNQVDFSCAQSIIGYSYEVVNVNYPMMIDNVMNLKREYR